MINRLTIPKVVSPLGSVTQWTCDTCNDPITNPEMAVVIGKRDSNDQVLGWKIVHKQCDPSSGQVDSFSVELTRYLGDDGLSTLLSLLSPGPLKGGNAVVPADLNEFVDLARRLHIPHYEEARTRFDEDSVRDELFEAAEGFPYMTDTLSRIAQGKIG
ncbi:hypothetical protein [Rhodococcus sp. NPDC058639]|uniref:hypothetical protein n=1 Tax=Rhodococcus sp. NPDC058639 TaxID=3346570 RepID=UPI00364B6706